MKNSQLFSRRANAAVDFRPDVEAKSPSAQLRRLSAYLEKDVPPADDITDCPDALDALREYSYRKLFTGTTHDEFLHLERTDPAHIDWALAIHEIEATNFRNAQKKDQNNASRR